MKQPEYFQSTNTPLRANASINSRGTSASASAERPFTPRQAGQNRAQGQRPSAIGQVARLAQQDKRAFEPSKPSHAKVSVSKWAIVCIVVGALLLGGLIIRPYFQQYWYVVRDGQYLQAVQAAQADHSAKVSSIVQAIQTPIGIEDRARAEYGWVLPGEKAVNVVGATATGESGSLPANFNAADVPLPGNWLTNIIDKLFGYQIGASGISLS